MNPEFFVRNDNAPEEVRGRPFIPRVDPICTPGWYAHVDGTMGYYVFRTVMGVRTAILRRVAYSKGEM